MSRAELRALEAYPPKYAKQERHPNRVQSEKVDTHQSMRAIYIKGYQQAEKDLALTWEDIEAIDQIFTDVFKDGFDVVTNKYYQEVLNQFNKLKEK